MQLHLSKIHITLVVTVPFEMLERHLPSSADVVGEELANQVVAAVKQHNIGYFPALDYFEKQGGIELDLLEAAETIAWFASRLVREEVNIKMRPFFSTIQFQSVQNLAYAMPNVRPNQLNAWPALVQHYTPNKVKLDLIASVLKKQEKPEGLANWARQLFTRNLKNSFDDYEIVQTSVIG